MDLYMRRSMVRTQIIDPEALAREVTDGLKKSLKNIKGKTNPSPVSPSFFQLAARPMTTGCANAQYQQHT